ncbi:CxxC motif-containing protein (DUF1111 family) [Mangrovibacterium diazotrophicum]|uniref:CxxC motif-containing protein (DUF1111 family) n=1 Tax=Mangrovibacterium diazotrophicum TaxID=1261403 RepID=A0A419W356_9BACT|nr:di-heme oxidoredictase family protein [Mangrovibacterium diazotrophicum]RKD89864.1 CxxC motif-containing protein (DUF1111 family) [Mangrovibacterium diazotrophicum]
MKKLNAKICFALLCFVVASCASKDDENLPSTLDGEAAGGDMTVYLSTSQAFGTPAPNLSAENLSLHQSGDIAFEATFVSNPSPRNGGLGPVFNNNACNSCHPADGRASFPSNVNAMSGFFFRISLPGTGEHGGPKPVPGFGTQLQHQALYGYEPEAKLQVTYSERIVELADGTEVSLQVPEYEIINPYMELPVDVQLSPRIGMPVFGLGLLEAIPAKAILANADPDDLDEDGISGKANYVWDVVTQSMQLGRFGWKAGAASILAQSAGAYSEDMGLTTYLHPIPATYGQTNGDTAITTIEVAREELEKVVFYGQTLGVPAARNFDDVQVIKGRQVFDKLNCKACHVPSFTTGADYTLAEARSQQIYPYTDMLLHDMGDDLADNRGEFEANGKEWKTRPLWGIGLTKLTSGHTSFLHDGRARNLTEAIVWHGGEAEDSRNGFIELSAADREALLAFLNAL